MLFFTTLCYDMGLLSSRLAVPVSPRYLWRATLVAVLELPQGKVVWLQVAESSASLLRTRMLCCSKGGMETAGGTILRWDYPSRVGSRSWKKGKSGKWECLLAVVVWWHIMLFRELCFFISDAIVWGVEELNFVSRTRSAKWQDVEEHLTSLNLFQTSLLYSFRNVEKP